MAETERENREREVCSGEQTPPSPTKGPVAPGLTQQQRSH